MIPPWPIEAAARQLALPLPHDPGYAAADFLPAPSNHEARAWLARTAEWPGGRLALWGEGGAGKTHLLHLWAEETGAALLPGPSLRGVPAPPGRALAVDDADAAPEAPLLHLLNAAAEAGRPVLLAGREPPARWGTRLPDLASRLRATASVQVHRAEDDLLRALLARLLSDRQLTLPEGLQDWLALRLPRDAASLREAVARLDRAALAAGGRVTRALAAAVLAGMGEEDGEAGPGPLPGPALL